MTTAQAVGAVSSEAALWYAIDWQAIHRNVRRLQVCIAQATYQSRVSLKEAFEGLEPDEAKVSRPVLRGPGPSNGVWLLGSNRSRHFSGTG
jgi:hypothetical protein